MCAVEVKISWSEINESEDPLSAELWPHAVDFDLRVRVTCNDVQTVSSARSIFKWFVFKIKRLCLNCWVLLKYNFSVLWFWHGSLCWAEPSTDASCVRHSLHHGETWTADHLWTLWNQNSTEKVTSQLRAARTISIRVVDTWQKINCKSLLIINIYMCVCVCVCVVLKNPFIIIFKCNIIIIVSAISSVRRTSIA